MDNFIYMFVMNDCRISNGYLSTYSLVLVYTCDGEWFLDGHVLLQVFTLKSWPSYSIFTCVK